jgi:hypothetical protein
MGFVRGGAAYPNGFEASLRDALVACSDVLWSEAYLEYLRSAFLEHEDEVVWRAILSGHGGVRELLRGFLEASARKGAIRESDFQFQAEMLLALVQGIDFVEALLCRQAPQPHLIRARIAAAAAGFCRQHALVA